MSGRVEGKARAKINLTLHVSRAITDPHDRFFRYHPVDSLVVFAGVGDDVWAEPANAFKLSIDGPHSAGLETGPDNLILKAVEKIACQVDIPTKAHFHLTKNLPIASGIGGGSADGAAAIRLLAELNARDHRDWADLAVSIGADVPVCLVSQTAHMTGIGEEVRPIAEQGELHSILVNPGIAVSTAEIFKAFDAAPTRDTPRPIMRQTDLLSRALDGRNDLEPYAFALAPIIRDVLSVISDQKGCQLARMSGSGATCFGIFDEKAQAEAAAQYIAAQYPDWWCVATRLGEP